MHSCSAICAMPGRPSEAIAGALIKNPARIEESRSKRNLRGRSSRDVPLWCAPAFLWRAWPFFESSARRLGVGVCISRNRRRFRTARNTMPHRTTEEGRCTPAALLQRSRGGRAENLLAPFDAGDCRKDGEWRDGRRSKGVGLADKS
jgi:hypothetical protein